MRLRPLSFTWERGAGLNNLIDPLGRLFTPSPFNIPQWPYRILRFALEYILVMIDKGYIKTGRDHAFDTPEQVWAFRNSVRAVLNSMVFHDAAYREQSSSVVGLPVPPLLNPVPVRNHGKKIPHEQIFNKGFMSVPESFKPLKELPTVKAGYALVLIIEVAETKPVANWELALVLDEDSYEWLHNVGPNGHYKIEAYEVRNKHLTLGNQSPQFE